MKFSLLLRHEKLTIPARGEGGDWILKTPDIRFRDVPRNEFTMMSLAGAVGINVPEVRLVPRELVDERLPAGVWPEHEEFAYAIRRFDRDERRGRIHIEDLAQVRNVYPEHKYEGNFGGLVVGEGPLLGGLRGPTRAKCSNDCERHHRCSAAGPRR